MVGNPSAVPALLLGLVVMLAGCDSSSSGSSVERNPGEGSSVRLTPDSFKVQGEQLDWAVYPGFFEAIQPSAGSRNKAEAERIIADMAKRMEAFIHPEHASAEVGASAMPQYRSLRNSIDLMTQVLYSDEVENFREGRAAVARAIDRELGFSYRNNDIVFTEPASEVEQGAPPSNWSYIVAMTHVVPESNPEEAELAEDIFERNFNDVVMQLIFALNSPGSQLSVLPAQRFTALGPQPAPLARVTSFTLAPRTEPVPGEPDPVAPAATLNQTWPETSESGALTSKSEDLWTWTDDQSRTFGSGDPVKCAHLRVDYEGGKAQFFTSTTPIRDQQNTESGLELGAGSTDNYRCGADYEGTDSEQSENAVEWDILPANQVKRYQAYP